MNQGKYIRSHFFRLVFPICAVIFMVAIGAYEWHQYHNARAALAHKLDKLASTYSLLYAEPLAIGNRDLLQAFTVSLLSDPDVAEVVVKDEDNYVLDEFITDYDESGALGKTISVNYATETGYGRVGALTLVLSDKRLLKDLRSHTLGHALMMLFLFTILMGCIAVVFRKSVNVPLQSLMHQASHDSLTDLINRRAFEDMLEHVIDNHRHAAGQHMLLYLDLDRFKPINDRFGHHVGDIALSRVARILQTCVREQDFVARVGGDEFAILLIDCDTRHAMLIGEKIRTRIASEAFSFEGSTHRIGISIGVTEIEVGASNPTEYLKLADKACYAAKRRGRNLMEIDAATAAVEIDDTDYRSAS